MAFTPVSQQLHPNNLVTVGGDASQLFGSGLLPEQQQQQQTVQQQTVQQPGQQPVQQPVQGPQAQVTTSMQPAPAAAAAATAETCMTGAVAAANGITPNALTAGFIHGSCQLGTITDPSSSAAAAAAQMMGGSWQPMLLVGQQQQETHQVPLPTPNYSWQHQQEQHQQHTVAVEAPLPALTGVKETRSGSNRFKAFIWCEGVGGSGKVAHLGTYSTTAAAAARYAEAAAFKKRAVSVLSELTPGAKELLVLWADHKGLTDKLVVMQAGAKFVLQWRDV